MLLQSLERERKAASEEAAAAGEKLRLAVEEAAQQDVEIDKAKKKASKTFHPSAFLALCCTACAEGMQQRHRTIAASSWYSTDVFACCHHHKRRTQVDGSNLTGMNAPSLETMVLHLLHSSMPRVQPEVATAAIASFGRIIPFQTFTGQVWH